MRRRARVSARCWDYYYYLVSGWPPLTRVVTNRLCTRTVGCDTRCLVSVGLAGAFGDCEIQPAASRAEDHGVPPWHDDEGKEPPGE